MLLLDNRLLFLTTENDFLIPQPNTINDMPSQPLAYMYLLSREVSRGVIKYASLAKRPLEHQLCFHVRPQLCDREMQPTFTELLSQFW